MKTWLVQIEPYGPSAKNKGIASVQTESVKLEMKYFYNLQIGYQSRFRWCSYFVVEAVNADDAMKQLETLFHPEDKRPLAGKSYLKALKIKKDPPRRGRFLEGFHSNVPKWGDV